MGVEIERKFLLRGEGWRTAVSASQAMRQGYLNQEKRCSVRVRVGGGRGWLNLKGVTIGAQRQEFEYEIPLADAQRILDDLSFKPLIEKVRHTVQHEGHVWEIDEFGGANAGLIVAEIELDSPDEPFAKPEWLGEEVTWDERYYNTCLSRHPYQEWGAAETAPPAD
jgi:adenylate cyclase